MDGQELSENENNPLPTEAEREWWHAGRRRLKIVRIILLADLAINVIFTICQFVFKIIPSDWLMPLSVVDIIVGAFLVGLLYVFIQRLNPDKRANKNPSTEM